MSGPLSEDGRSGLSLLGTGSPLADTPRSEDTQGTGCYPEGTIVVYVEREVPVKPFQLETSILGLPLLCPLVHRQFRDFGLSPPLVYRLDFFL